VKRQTVVVLVIAIALAAVLGSIGYIVLVPGTKGTPSLPPGPPGNAVCSGSGGSGSSGNWTTYHQDNLRSGMEPSPEVTAAHSAWSGSTLLDADVYAEPLVCGNAVYVATEENTVYAINASSGAIIWHTHLGTPVTSSTLPCGDIGPTTGITGTPVIDMATGILYAVAFLSSNQHVLFGVNVDNGSVVSQVVVDPSGADPTAEQERGGLAIANGYVYVVYGGLFGDCGDYHGWVVAAPLSGSGGLLSYMVPTHREGGIWAVAGLAIAANGNLYVTTGNGDSSTTFDHGDAVIELSPTLSEIGYFAPTNWATLNSQDDDLGTVAPTLLPNGDVFQVGKEGVGYLLSGSNLGGIGGQVANITVCSSAYGGTAAVGMSVFVPCVDGVIDVVVGASNLSVAWQTSSFDAGSPIVTGNVVWAVNIPRAILFGFNISTGKQLFSFPLASADHFISPAAGPGSVYVAGGDQLFAFALS